MSTCEQRMSPKWTILEIILSRKVGLENLLLYSFSLNPSLYVPICPPFCFWPKTKMENDQNGRRTRWETTKMKDDQNGRWPKLKMTTIHNKFHLLFFFFAFCFSPTSAILRKVTFFSMEDDQNEIRPKWKTTKMEDDQNWKWPKLKTSKMEDDQNGIWPKWKTT